MSTSVTLNGPAVYNICYSQYVYLATVYTLATNVYTFGVPMYTHSGDTDSVSGMCVKHTFTFRNVCHTKRRMCVQAWTHIRCPECVSNTHYTHSEHRMCVIGP